MFVEITTIMLRDTQRNSKCKALDAFGRSSERVVIEHPNGAKETFEGVKKQNVVFIDCSWYAALYIGYTSSLEILREALLSSSSKGRRYTSITGGNQRGLTSASLPCSKLLQTLEESIKCRVTQVSKANGTL